MRIDYFCAGIDSLEVALEHLSKNSDRDLRIAILLSYHGISCLLKAAAVNQGISVTKGDKSVPFPTLIGALKAKSWISSNDNKPLTLLNELRNALEHREVDYDRERFEVAIHSCLPIIEKVVRECNEVDLQDALSTEAWNILIEIEEFFKHREETLDEIVKKALDKPYGKDALLDPAESVLCEECYHDGLPWKGTERELVVCKFCKIESIIATCAICNSPVIIKEDDEWPYFHSDCWDNYINSDD